MLLPGPEHFAATLDMVCYSPAGWNKRFSVRNVGMDVHVSIIGYAVDCITVEVLNQSQGGMCISGVLRVGVEVAQEGVGP